MRTQVQRTCAAAALLFVVAALQVAAQQAGDIATSTDASGNLYTATVAADGTVPVFTPADVQPIGAAGGGGGVPTTHPTLQSISGYNPPNFPPIPTPAPTPGTIVSPADIPGYTQAENGQGTGQGQSGAAAAFVRPMGASSLADKLPIALSAMAVMLGGAVVLL